MQCVMLVKVHLDYLTCKDIHNTELRGQQSPRNQFKLFYSCTLLCYACVTKAGHTYKPKVPPAS